MTGAKAGVVGGRGLGRAVIDGCGALVCGWRVGGYVDSTPLVLKRSYRFLLRGFSGTRMK